MKTPWKTLVGADEIPHNGIERLIQKASTYQWVLDDIDWGASSPVVEQASEPLRELISQAYYAELATIEVCSQLLGSKIGLQAKRFLATQVADEGRHAQAYLNYLNKIGGVKPVHPKMNDIFTSVIEDENLPDLCKVIAVNILLEGEALNQQGKRSQAIPCPIFHQINHRILIDESRHHAFGKMFAPFLVDQHTEEELLWIGKWCKGIWENWVMANRGRYESADAQQFQVLENEIQRRWPLYEEELSKMGIIFEQKEAVCEVC